MNLNSIATDLFKKVCKYPNFIPRDILERGFCSNWNYVYEIAEGTGMNHQPIFGVTIVNTTTNTQCHDISDLFQSLKEAREHIASGIIFLDGSEENEILYKTFTLAELDEMPTVWDGHIDNCKKDLPTVRLLISRMTKEDGAKYDNEVTIEKYDSIIGKWYTYRTYKAD